MNSHFSHRQIAVREADFWPIGHGYTQPATDTISAAPLATQRAIVAELESERKLVDANRELIARMEQKIQAKLAEIWGDDAAAPSSPRENKPV